MEQGAWGRDPRPWGLSGGLVTGLSGAPSQPTQPERVLGWLPAPSQAVGPGPLGELSLGSARKSLRGPQESSSTALLTPDGRQEEEGRPAGRPRDVGCPVGQRADHGRPLGDRGLAAGPCLGHLAGWTSGTGMGWVLGHAPSWTPARLLQSPPTGPLGDSIALPEPSCVHPVFKGWGPPSARVRGSG